LLIPRIFIRKFADMFDDEDEEIYGGDVNDDLVLFNTMYEKNQYDYFDPDRIEALIDHLLVTNQFKKAKWAAEMAREHFPFNNLFYLRQAQAMSLMGDIKESLKMLSHLEKIDTPSLDLYLTIASSFSQLRDSESAIKYFNKALELAEVEERADIYIDIAMEYENIKDYHNAVKTLEKAMREEPLNESIVYELAYCYDQVKDYEKSIDCFLKFLDEDPYSYTAWYNLGNAYVKLKEFEKALKAYDYCIVINEDFVPAYYNTANTYVELEEYNKAIEFYQKCIGLDGDDSLTFCSLGECYEELERYDEAIHYYDKSLVLMPELADAWLGKGVVFEAMGDFPRAVSSVEMAIDLDDSVYGYYHVLAGILEKHGDTQDARVNYERAIELLQLAEDDDLVIDYLSFLSKEFNDELYEVIEENLTINKSDATNLFLVNEFWSINKRTEALALFDELMISNPSLAKSLFLHFEDLKQYSEFTSRIDEK